MDRPVLQIWASLGNVPSSGIPDVNKVALHSHVYLAGIPYLGRLNAEQFTRRKIGMPTDIDAPRGGRAELIRSADGGKTWSRPTILLDTPWDDRAPNFCQLQGGTILCSLFR